MNLKRNFVKEIIVDLKLNKKAAMRQTFTKHRKVRPSTKIIRNQ